jgi:phosphoserine phosphatase RsbU/P
VHRLIPKSRMGIFALVVIILWTLKTAFFTPALRSFAPRLGFFLDLLTPLLAIPAVYYIWKIFKSIRNRLLWKIRRRLVLAHIFIGAIPVFLVISIFYFSALLFYYQLSYYLISNQIGIHAAQIHAFNLALRDGMQELTTGPSAPSPTALKEALDSGAKYLLGSYPSATIIFRFTDPATSQDRTYVNQNSSPGWIKKYEVPRWLAGGEFNGLVMEDMQPQIYRQKLFLRSFIYSDMRSDLSFSIEVSVPFDRYFLGRLKAVLGQDLLLADHISVQGLEGMLKSTDVLQENIVESTFELEKTQIIASTGWPIYLFPVSWATGADREPSDSEMLLVELSTSAMISNVFRSESSTGKKILGVLNTTLVFFLVVEIASIVIGILLTKSITNAIHSLDRGTEFVKRGDFNHRILVRSDDQLGALAASFNQMTEYVQHLVKERVQKERLERELEIAKEVQQQLFPERAPQMSHMDISGSCLPARVVSGDYYDFLPLGGSELGIALGDICGKGISAALLMANLQATLRSNVINLWRNNSLNGEKTVAEIVQSLNNQIYSYTAANKFASFFYAVYSDSQKTLTYCNAGHNPPLYFSGNGVQRLRAGGMVVGVFADSQYDQETIHLEDGDLLLAYTDGIVESINEYGEEFGEERLIQLVRKNRHLDADKIKASIVEHVLSWTFAEERDDDMTLIVAKII